MRRNPLLYSNPSEIEQSPPPVAAPAPKQSSGKSSFLFYFIILANSLLVLFVLGFIWFLFLKSPDIQIKEISNRLFGTGGTPTEPSQQTIIAPEVQTEVIIKPTQQEKDEIQQTKLKQMREKEELAAERTRLEEIKADLEKEKKRAAEAQQAITSLQTQKKAQESTEPTTSTVNEANISTETEIASEDEKAVEIEQTRVETPDAKPEEVLEATSSVSKEATVVPNVTKEPASNTTSSQVDLIMEALKNQQQN